MKALGLAMLVDKTDTATNTRSLSAQRPDRINRVNRIYGHRLEHVETSVPGAKLTRHVIEALRWGCMMRCSRRA